MSTVIDRRREHYGPRGRPISMIRRQERMVDRLVTLTSSLRAAELTDKDNEPRLRRLRRNVARMQKLYSEYSQIIRKIVSKAPLNPEQMSVYDRADKRMRLRRKM